MPTGYQVLFPWGAPTTLSDKDFNQVLRAMLEAVRDEFLTQVGFELDREPNREEHEWWSTRTEAQQHYFLPPRYVQSWIKGNWTKVEAVVFILGPFYGNLSESGKEGVVVFCYCEMDHQIREFWRGLAEFLEKKMPRIVEDLKLEVTT